MRFLSFLVLFLFTIASLSAQQTNALRGFYTGEAKIIGQRTQFGVQLDLVEEEETTFAGIFRLRAIENNQVTGCDYLVSGILEDGKLNLNLLSVVKETNVPSGGCNIFSSIKLAVEVKEAAPKLKGNLIAYSGRDNIAKVELERIDRENSFTVEEEIREGKRIIAETYIANAPDDSVRIAMMLSYRPTELVDSVEISSGEAILEIEAPDADLYHKLTLLVNDNVVIFNKAPKQQGIRVRLVDLPPGGRTELFFLCYHYLLTVNYPVQVVLIWDGGSKRWEFPVSVFQNKRLLIKRAEE